MIHYFISQIEIALKLKNNYEIKINKNNISEFLVENNKCKRLQIIPKHEQNQVIGLKFELKIRKKYSIVLQSVQCIVTSSVNFL